MTHQKKHGIDGPLNTNWEGLWEETVKECIVSLTVRVFLNPCPSFYGKPRVSKRNEQYRYIHVTKVEITRVVFKKEVLKQQGFHDLKEFPFFT